MLKKMENAMIEDQKEIQKLLDENKILNVILEDTDIDYCEFNHLTKQSHVSGVICRENNIPEYVEHMMETLTNLRIIYPDDVFLFEQKVEEIRKGANNVEFIVRIYSQTDNKYKWRKFSSSIQRENDTPVKTVVIGVSVDDFVKKEMELENLLQREKKFRDQMDSSIFAYCRYNVSKNIIEDADVHMGGLKYHLDQLPVDHKTRIKLLLKDLQIDEQKLDMFNAKNLIDSFNKGNKILRLTYWATSRHDQKNVLVKTICRLLEHPNTRDIIAFFYDQNLKIPYLQNGMLKELSKHSYDRCAALFIHNHTLCPILEFTSSYSHYWDDTNYETGLWNFCNKEVDEKDRMRVYNEYQINNIVSHLKTDAVYRVKYDIVDDTGNLHRKEALFSYLDEENGIILIARTDIAYYEEIRHIATIDSLTGLYKRNHIFMKIRKMLDQNPNEQFVFYRIDID